MVHWLFVQLHHLLNDCGYSILLRTILRCRTSLGWWTFCDSAVKWSKTSTRRKIKGKWKLLLGQHCKRFNGIILTVCGHITWWTNPDLLHDFRTPRFYLAAMEKNWEKACDQYYFTGQKWWTQYVLTESTISSPWCSNNPRPSPNFFPWLWEKIWEWPGDNEANIVLLQHHDCKLVSMFVLWDKHSSRVWK